MQDDYIDPSKVKYSLNAKTFINNEKHQQFSKNNRHILYTEWLAKVIFKA